MKLFFKDKKLGFFIFFLLLSIFSVGLATRFLNKYLPALKTTDALANYQSPQIYIYGGEGGFSSAGLITLASTDEPAVQIGGYNISGTAEITMYQADLPSLLSYLTHDANDKQINSAPDVSKFQYVATTDHDINTSTYAGSKIDLPFSDTGIWYLKIKIGTINADAFVLRSNTGVLAKQGNGEFILWGQDFKTKRSITGGSVQVYNLKNGQNVIQTTNFDATGIAHATLSQDADIALAQFGDDIAIVPLNLMYLNSGGGSGNSFAPPPQQTKYFTFTDRPLYKPGDTVYFKSVLRDDDDARYSIQQGLATVKIYTGYDDKSPLLNKNIPISSNGTINGEFIIPADSKVGYYTLSVDAGGQYPDTTGFDVEYYQKPESYIDVTTPKTEVIAGDKTTFKILGNYFSGQPLVNQQVKYVVTSSNFYEYEYLNDAQSLEQNLSNDFRYSFPGGSNTVTQGEVNLDQYGQATVNLDTKMNFNQGKSQVFTIEVTLVDGSQSPPYARRNILVYSGEFGIFRTDNSYGGQVNTKINLPLALYANNPSANLSGVNLTAKVHRTSWTEYQDPTQKYPSYKKDEEDLPDLSAVTDSKGNTAISFVPAKTGLYMLTVQGTDARGNLVAKVFYEYISEQGQPAYTDQGGDQLTVSLDKQKYSAVDTAKISVYSAIPDRDVFLSLERGRMDRFQIVHLTGNNGSASVPLILTDVPNMFAKVSSFSNSGMDSNVVDIPVSTNGKRVLVEVTPNSAKYGPGDNVTLNISTTDANGNPVSSDVAVWAVDKAIFELSDNTLGDIFNTFWSERYDSTQESHSLEGIVVYSAESGGCFTEGTKVLMADGKTKNIEDIKVGDSVLTRESPDSPKLVKAKVVSLQNAEDDGYLIINDNLKITPDHILWVNGSWTEASVIQKGDKLLDAGGNTINVNTIEWQGAKTKVYNLDIENYHTFFADGVWVHNQKGASRSTFKDTAYWNPSVQTDSSGKAQVTFKLPDNLTTWTIAAVADTSDTRVGQTTAEIVVSKDIIVRPILPNILRQGDKANISALVQNFTDKDNNFNVGLTFDSGTVPTPDFKNVTIKSNSMEELTWEVDPTSLNTNAKLTFSAFVANDKYSSDTIVQEIPVVPFEFEEKTGESGSGNKTFNVELSPDVNKDKSNITLSLSSTLLGTLPSAMRYLINYPYGCTEQTTSELTPSLVAKSNPTFFADALTGKDINAIINAGISKLINKQNSDGGWTWWFTGASSPFITSYVIDNLVYAKSLGYKIDQVTLDSAKNYLETPTYYDQASQSQKDFSTDEWIVKDYGLTLFGDSAKAKKIDGNTDGLTSDIQSILVMTNYINGDENPVTNGLNKLISLANKDGDMVYWNEGSKINFGSKDASTALAIRAIVLAKGDLNIARQGALYLVRNRHYEYWSSTFGTAETIRALTSLSNVQSDLNPNFSYNVNLDGSTLISGTVNKANQTIKDIVIPVSKVKASGSNVTVSINGQGDLYSTLLADEFHTDKNAKAQGNGLTIKREYINEKGTEYTLSPGDTAIVKLTVQGPTTTENYAVITDELPSGMVPINPGFNNEQYGSTTDQSSYFTSPDVDGMDVTQNGVEISLYQLTPGEHVFTYKARVVNAGTFSVPPATVALMYAPEIYGRSDAQSMVIGKISKTIPAIVVQKFANKYLKWIILAVVLTIAVIISTVILLKKKVFSRKMKNPPSTDLPPSQPIQ